MDILVLILLLFFYKIDKTNSQPVTHSHALTDGYKPITVVCTNEKGQDTYIYRNAKIIKKKEIGLFYKKTLYTIQTQKGNVSIVSANCVEVEN